MTKQQAQAVSTQITGARKAPAARANVPARNQGPGPNETKRLLTSTQQSLQKACDAQAQAQLKTARQKESELAKVHLQLANILEKLADKKLEADEMEQKKDKIEQDYFKKKAFFANLQKETEDMKAKKLER